MIMSILICVYDVVYVLRNSTLLFAVCRVVTDPSQPRTVLCISYFLLIVLYFIPYL